jgi:site-specific DNA-methyltransferase (adenine-specific)
LRAFGEPGAIVYLADCVELMKIMPPGSVDVVFADPPYRLSRGGVTVKNGRLAPVDKGAWDRSMGIDRTGSLRTSPSALLVSSTVPSG